MPGIQKQINFWKDSAEEDWLTAQSLLKSRRYAACLFFCHLMLEKLLKGLVVARTGQAAPFLHDLEKLAALAGLGLSDDQSRSLRIISSFNVSGRYDDVKRTFFTSCNKEYAGLYVTISRKIYLWIKKEYPKG